MNQPSMPNDDGTIYPEVIESAFRTIELARPDLRERVFSLQAIDALRSAEIAGLDKINIIDRLENIAIAFGWPAGERQRLIAAASDQADQPVEDDYRPTEELSFDDGLRPPEFSDEALALRFAECHDDFRFIAKQGRWYAWDGQRWREDETLLARDKVRGICRAVAAQCGEAKAKIAKAIASAKTVGGVERLSQADRRIAATVDQFDADPFLVNTSAGIIDPRSGAMRDHDRRAYITKITGVAPNSMATPAWGAFLSRITNGDIELIEYLQRVMGYCLTGSTKEHALFFLYGTGANGKTTFLNAVTAPQEIITVWRRSRHLPRAAMIGTQPTSPDCVARASSLRLKLKKGAVGRKAELRA